MTVSRDKELVRTQIVSVISPVFVAFLLDDIFSDTFLPHKALCDKKRDQTYKQLGVGRKDCNEWTMPGIKIIKPKNRFSDHPSFMV